MDNEITAIYDNQPIVFTLEEIDTARYIANGMNNEEISDLLHVSAHTVKDRMRKIVAKTNAKNRTQAIAILTRLKLI